MLCHGLTPFPLLTSYLAPGPHIPETWSPRAVHPAAVSQAWVQPSRETTQAPPSQKPLSSRVRGQEGAGAVPGVPKQLWEAPGALLCHSPSRLIRIQGGFG